MILLAVLWVPKPSNRIPTNPISKAKIATRDSMEEATLNNAFLRCNRGKTKIGKIKAALNSTRKELWFKIIGQCCRIGIGKLWVHLYDPASNPLSLVPCLRNKSKAKEGSTPNKPIGKSSQIKYLRVKWDIINRLNQEDWRHTAQVSKNLTWLSNPVNSLNKNFQDLKQSMSLRYPRTQIFQRP